MEVQGRCGARLATALVTLLILTGCSRPSNPPAARRPNILFILLDDLRWDTVGYARHPHLKTPNIDRIANEGVTFRNAFSTTSLCSPSRASLLSGLYAHAVNVEIILIVPRLEELSLVLRYLASDRYNVEADYIRLD